MLLNIIKHARGCFLFTFNDKESINSYFYSINKGLFGNYNIHINYYNSLDLTE